MDIISVLSRISDLPTLPSSLSRIFFITQDVNSDFSDFVGILETDQSLASKVLKVANSPLFGYSKEIQTLERAVAVVGFSEIRNIALGMTAFDSFLKSIGRTSIDRKRFWSHSYTCAFTTRYIAPHFKVDDQDFAYVGGLLHDVGKTILDHYFQPIFFQVLQMVEDQRVPFIEAELEKIGTGHDAIGAYIAQRWNFPEALANAVADHHKISPQGDALGDLINLADLLVHMMGQHCHFAERQPTLEQVLAEPISLKFMKRLDMPEENYSKLISTLVSDIETYLEQTQVLI